MFNCIHADYYNVWVLKKPYLRIILFLFLIIVNLGINDSCYHFKYMIFRKGGVVLLVDKFWYFHQVDRFAY